MAALIVVVVAIVVAVGAFFVLRSGEEDTGLAAMSTRGRPAEIPVPERLGPWGEMTGKALLIGARKGVRFVRLPRKDGSSCWASADRRGGVWNITGYACETGFLRFPDKQRPVMLVGRQSVTPGGDPRIWTYDTFGGFAADGIKQIAIVDADDRMVRVADVVQNVFYAATPPTEVKQVVGLDEAGEVIWRGPVRQIPDE